MVNQSELPFRLMCKKYGADLGYTPMIHSRMCYKKRGHIDKAFHTNKEDGPVIAQFCANNSQEFVYAAKLVQDRVAGVDLNLGCPQGIAKRGHYGAFLLEEFSLLKEMVSLAHLHLSVPVTCKIRILPKLQDTLALCNLLQNAGCQILTVHGRTRDMLQQKIGGPDLSTIARIKREMKIPIFSNGGIEKFEDIERTFQLTGADGVMVSEALLGNPCLFSGKIYDTLDMAEEYIEFAKKYPSPVAQFAVRPHLYKILYKELCYYKDLRTEWNKADIEVLYNGPSEIRKRREREKTHQDIENMPSWYRRHRAKQVELRIREEKKRAALEAERIKEEAEEAANEDKENLLQTFFDDTDDE
ncbi:hypothetical protein AAMO2058_000541700 [Amorphochlora amoebiformis]